MAWDAIDLRTEGGVPLSDADREIILDVAGKAIIGIDRDPAVVIRAVKRVGRKLRIIQNLRAYATRAVNVALQRSARAQDLKERAVCHVDVEAIADLERRDQIANQVLVRELLEGLTALDREVVLRRASGEPFTAIDREMDLKPRTAEIRFRAARLVLRRILDEKLGRQTGPRGR